MAHAQGSQAAEFLGAVRENPAALVLDPTKELRAFRPAASTTLGTRRGRGRGSFIDSVLTAVNGFYGDVLGSLRAWAAAPPKLRPVHAEPPELNDTVAAALASTDYSSQDGAEGGPVTRHQNDHPYLAVAAASGPRTGVVVDLTDRSEGDQGGPQDVTELSEHPSD